MGEEGGVEINPQIILLRKIDPRVKMAAFELIPIHLFAAGHGIAGVQIDALLPGIRLMAFSKSTMSSSGVRALPG